MSNPTFVPEYIFEYELAGYGLPAVAQLPTIMNLVDAASSLIDSYCGRIDGLGTGSLVYSTYVERQLLPPGRNLCRLSKPPLVAVDQEFMDTLASYNATGYNGVSGNHYWTGALGNGVVLASGDLSSIISASGRYGYGRRDSQMSAPDMNYGSNILQVAAFFGGPPQWTAINPSMVEYNDEVGEIWLPAGLYLSSYTEVLVKYNAGFNPIALPNNIKMACAALVKNFIIRAGGATSLTGYDAGRIHAQFTPDLIDTNIQQWLKFYAHVVSM